MKFSYAASSTCCLNRPVYFTETRQLHQQAATQQVSAEKPGLLVSPVGKGANGILRAKYVINPLVKTKKSNKGKALLRLAINRDRMNETCFLLPQTGPSKHDGLKTMTCDYFAGTQALSSTLLNKIKK